MVTKYFQKSHKPHKIFNHSAVKAGYSCMNNMLKVKNDQNAIVEKKQNVQWKGTAKVMMEFINVM